MMSSRREHARHTSKPHRALRSRPHCVLGRSRSPRPPVPHDQYLDGLFTYCLSVMCEHETAVGALAEALVLAERQRERGRRPADRSLHRPWLYALARWACLRRLAEYQERGEESYGPESDVPVAEHVVDHRRQELSTLAWPEAAGTTPEQREALELAVRHQLPAIEVAAVIGEELEETHTLLSRAACEVERTRAALTVVGTGDCATLARLGADDGVLLSAALRQELVRHVDECAQCRRSAERAMADGPWPGTAPTGSEVLPVITAPRPAVLAAMDAGQRVRAQDSPRFDRRGFPVDTRDRAARIARLRSRAITLTVIAAVLAVPTLAAWTTYQGGRTVSKAHATASASARHLPAGDVPAGPPRDQPALGTSPPWWEGRARDGARPGARDGSAAPDQLALRVAQRPGPLTVTARPRGHGTVLTLTFSGTTPVDWSAQTRASWLRLSRTEGTGRPGETQRVEVTVDLEREPDGPWGARVRLAPVQAVIAIQGEGGTPARPNTRRADGNSSAEPAPSGNAAPSRPRS